MAAQGPIVIVKPAVPVQNLLLPEALHESPSSDPSSTPPPLYSSKSQSHHGAASLAAQETPDGGALNALHPHRQGVICQRLDHSCPGMCLVPVVSTCRFLTFDRGCSENMGSKTQLVQLRS